MKKVVFRGPVLTRSGYGTHSLQVARWLLSRSDVDVRFICTPWGDTPWLLDANYLDGTVGKIMDRSIPDQQSSDFDVSIQLQLPNEWNPSLAKKNVGMTAAIETDRCNPDWIRCVDAMDVVIVPSTHARASITNTGTVNKNILVIPEAFNDEIVKEHDQLNLELETKFNFLIFGQLTGSNAFNDRKNTYFTLKWLCETFKNDPDVGIILKTNMGKNTKIDKQNVLNTARNVLKEARIGQFPKLHILHGDMNDKEIAGLYKNKSIKALVALTRGEGFGLPIIDAAASGLPIIATNWSGHLDFLKLGNFIKVSYQMIDVHPSRIDGNLFMKGSRWAQPSEDEAKKKLSKFRDNSSIPTEWAADLKKKIVENYSFTAISSLYDEAFEVLLQ